MNIFNFSGLKPSNSPDILHIILVFILHAVFGSNINIGPEELSFYNRQLRNEIIKFAELSDKRD